MVMSVDPAGPAATLEVQVGYLLADVPALPGTAFNDGVRYGDWLLTVSLLLIELLLVMKLPPQETFNDDDRYVDWP
jgi:hypothetical protein